MDMESSLRTVLKDGTDVFDVNKAFQCVTTVIEKGLAPGGGAGGSGGSGGSSNGAGGK